jgi:phage-related protein
MGGIIAAGLERLPENRPAAHRAGSLCGAVRRGVSGGESIKGFRRRSVLEIVADHNTDTWRAIYTARFGDTIYVLHAFQKKSKKGIATPQKDIELIRQRLAAAERDHRERQN